MDVESKWMVKKRLKEEVTLSEYREKKEWAFQIIN